MAASDVVLVAYTAGHVGSSGVLLQAIASGKPVIGPSSGLLAQHIETHRLGQSVDPGSTEEFTQALERAVLDPLGMFDREAASAFGSANSADRFAEVLFGELACPTKNSESG